MMSSLTPVRLQAGDTIMGRLGRRVKDGVYGLGGVRLWNSDISSN